MTETEVTKNINRDSSIEGFSVEGMRVFIKDDKINVEYNGNSYEVTMDEMLEYRSDDKNVTDDIKEVIN